MLSRFPCRLHSRAVMPDFELVLRCVEDLSIQQRGDFRSSATLLSKTTWEAESVTARRRHGKSKWLDLGCCLITGIVPHKSGDLVERSMDCGTCLNLRSGPGD